MTVREYIKENNITNKDWFKIYDETGEVPVRSFCGHHEIVDEDKMLDSEIVNIKTPHAVCIKIDRLEALTHMALFDYCENNGLYGRLWYSKYMCFTQGGKIKLSESNICDSFYR